MVGGVLIGWRDTGRREPHAAPGAPAHEVWALLVSGQGNDSHQTLCVHVRLGLGARVDLSLGDGVWWQSREVYHTPLHGRWTDRALERVGYSHGVTDCGCWPEYVSAQAQGGEGS